MFTCGCVYGTKNVSEYLRQRCFDQLLCFVERGGKTRRPDFLRTGPSCFLSRQWFRRCGFFLSRRALFDSCESAGRRAATDPSTFPSCHIALPAAGLISSGIRERAVLVAGLAPPLAVCGKDPSLYERPSSGHTSNFESPCGSNS